MLTIQLPAQVLEEQLLTLLHALTAKESDREIEIDFRNVKFYSPAALVLVAATTHSWLRQNRSIKFLNIRGSPAYKYLQRINLFKACGLDLDEDFNRHDADRRFLPLEKVGGKGARSNTEIATDAANCVAPELADSFDPEVTGFYDLLEYSISELANNVTQHSRAYGFVAAQHTPRSGYVRLGIADCGIGILESFRTEGSPVYKPGMTDREAIEEALKPKVSSKTHHTTAWGGGPVNAGVGLTMLKEISIHLDGVFTVVSGTHMYFQTGKAEPVNIPLPPDSVFAGTMCAVRVKRDHITNFAQILHGAKQAVGLLPNTTNLTNLFT